MLTVTRNFPHHDSDIVLGNKVKAFNTLAVFLLTFSFGVVKWTKTDFEALE